MKRVFGIITAFALLTSGQALAIAKGGTLYIKTKGVKLLKDAKAGAASVGAELKVGAEVAWDGPSDKDKTFHKVKVDGKEGYVLMSNLSPSKPAPEMMEGKSVDAQAFASSGAATKGLTSASLKYAKASGPNLEKAACQVIYAEEHNKAKQTDVALAAKSKELGGAK